MQARWGRGVYSEGKRGGPHQRLAKKKLSEVAKAFGFCMVKTLAERGGERSPGATKNYGTAMKRPPIFYFRAEGIRPLYRRGDSASNRVRINIPLVDLQRHEKEKRTHLVPVSVGKKKKSAPTDYLTQMESYEGEAVRRASGRRKIQTQPSRKAPDRRST